MSFWAQAQPGLRQNNNSDCSSHEANDFNLIIVSSSHQFTRQRPNYELLKLACLFSLFFETNLSKENSYPFPQSNIKRQNNGRLDTTTHLLSNNFRSYPKNNTILRTRHRHPIIPTCHHKGP
mmetsp:Transcript_53463/g.64467  ORF Transcript_53463/g.64467 Transcript_53463/m.64467 type:complete len:122 (-) Transcript_53463:824-1189(-)